MNQSVLFLSFAKIDISTLSWLRINKRRWIMLARLDIYISSYQDRKFRLHLSSRVNFYWTRERKRWLVVQEKEKFSSIDYRETQGTDRCISYIDSTLVFKNNNNNSYFLINWFQKYSTWKKNHSDAQWTDKEKENIFFSFYMRRKIHDYTDRFIQRKKQTKNSFL